MFYNENDGTNLDKLSIEEIKRLAMPTDMNGENLTSVVESLNIESPDDEPLEDFVKTAAAMAGAGAYALDAIGERYANNNTTAKQSLFEGAATRSVGISKEDLSVWGENFSERTPDKISEMSIELNKRVTKRNKFSETIFPTIVKPLGTVSHKAYVKVPWLKQTFKRNTGTNEVPKDINFYKEANNSDGVLTRNDSEVMPVVGVKSVFDEHLALDFKTKAVDPQTGIDIETAPVKIGSPVPYLDLCQSAAALTDSVMDDKTMLNPTMAVKNLGAKVGDEFYLFDLLGVNSAKFGPTFEGSSHDMGMNTQFIYSTVLTGKKMVNGDTGTEFDGAENVTFVYSIYLTGIGVNTTKALTGVCNSIDLVGMVVDGVEVKESNPKYNDWRDIGLKLSKDSIQAIGYKSYLANDDLYREGKRVTFRDETAAYTINPTSPYTVVTDIKGNGATTPGDKELVKQLTEIMMFEINLEVPAVLISLTNTLRQANGGSGLLPEGTVTGTIGDWLIKPYFKETDLPLETSLNSSSHDARQKDIDGAITLHIKRAITDMYTDSTLGRLRDDLGKSRDVVIAVGSDIAPFVPSKVDIGSEYNIKIVSTEATNFKGIIMALPGNFSSTRNTLEDHLSIGAYLYTPALVRTFTHDKAIETTAMLFAENAVFCPVLSMINVTGLKENEALGRVATPYINV